MTAPSWVVHHGNCLDVMPTFGADSIDSICCDPPYGLSFMGKGWDHGVPGVPFWTEALRVAKPGAHLLAFGGTRTFHRLTCAIEDAGWEVRDCLSWLYGSGFPKSLNGPWGGTALKPAWEPVILARKPLVGTVAANHAAHGTGALNVDGCRIGVSKRVPASVSNAGNRVYGAASARTEDESGRDPNIGRWPANVALDEDAAAALDEQSGVLVSGPESDAGHRRNADSEAKRNAYGGFQGQEKTGVLYGDAGGASRFFYTAKASRGEREAGLREAGLREAGRQVLGDYQGTDDHPPKVGLARARNTHPTVKPVDLMRWLVRLVTPVGGTALDPFLGSGTTGVAALEEGCRFIGIEREAEYVAIARARIAAAANAPTFDFTGGV